jgi:hypothetical protein
MVGVAEMKKHLEIHDSISDYGVLLAALSKPFASSGEVLASYGVTAEQLAKARAHWLPVLREDPIVRQAFARAFSGRGIEPKASHERTDETVMLPPHPPRLSAPTALPFVDGVFAPQPAEPLIAKVRSDADPDATQLGGAPTAIPLPFVKVPLRGAK